jgi:hypothetical protein
VQKFCALPYLFCSAMSIFLKWLINDIFCLLLSYFTFKSSTFILGWAELLNLILLSSWFKKNPNLYIFVSRSGATHCSRVSLCVKLSLRPTQDNSPGARPWPALVPSQPVTTCSLVPPRHAEVPPQLKVVRMPSGSTSCIVPSLVGHTVPMPSRDQADVSSNGHCPVPCQQ